MLLTKEFRFEASHILPLHPGKCSRLHGHSWVLKVSVRGKVQRETGFVMDYADISSIVKPLIDRLDHRHLGQWSNPARQQGIPTSTSFVVGVGTSHMVEGLPPDFYPSSENLLVWIGHQLLEAGLDWAELELDETCTSSARMTMAEYIVEESGRIIHKEEDRKRYEKG